MIQLGVSSRHTCDIERLVCFRKPLRFFETLPKPVGAAARPGAVKLHRASSGMVAAHSRVEWLKGVFQRLKEQALQTCAGNKVQEQCGP